MHFSQNLIRRLVQTKQIFIHGQIHFLRTGEFNKIQAILSFDQAVELFLNTLIAEFDGEPKDRFFKDLWAEANSCLQKIPQKRGLGKVELPLKKEIFSSVRHLRNSAQHNAHSPSESDLLRAKNIIEEFLRRTFMLAFEKNFDHIFLADAIKYEDIRQFFQEAEEAFNKKDWVNASIGLSKCYVFLKPHMTKSFPWEDSLENTIQSKLDINSMSGMEDIIEIIKYVDHKINILANGVSLQDFKLLEEKAPIVHVTAGGVIVGIRHKTSINEDECTRLFNFIYNLILNCQSVVPTGSQKWKFL